MVTLGIKETIRVALLQEEESGQLRQNLAQEVPLLRDKLVLPENEPVLALMEFVTNYVESVPGCLHLVTALSKEFGFYDYAAPFLHMAEDYFLQPPNALPQDGGLEALLDEAFLAHRLLEEVNDHHIRHLQRPLVPLDMTEANIIVHHLLGDAFATSLEQLVQFAAGQLLGKEYVWDQIRALPGSSRPDTALISSEQIMGPKHSIRLRLSA